MLGKISEKTVIKILNLAVTSREIIKSPFAQLSALGVGGLPPQAKEILSTIIDERRSPIKEYRERMGLPPTKGLLLYGPPGTGKTLLARSLGALLGCSEEHVQLLSGTSVYSKWVGASEANVRALFAPALEACKKFKNDSEIFLLIIDEIDGILSQRHGGSSNKWQNTVVNEFLAQMDGLEQFDNILVVGMTNRLEDLDAAIVRSGRFGSHIQLSLPELAGRKEILQIHCQKMLDAKLLDDDINFDKLAAETAGMSGADLQNLVKKAAGHALKRFKELYENGVELGPHCKEAKTCMLDLKKALSQLKQAAETLNSLPFGMYQ